MTRGVQAAHQIILPSTTKKDIDGLTEKQKLQAVSLWQKEPLQALSGSARLQCNKAEGAYQEKISE